MPGSNEESSEESKSPGFPERKAPLGIRLSAFQTGVWTKPQVLEIAKLDFVRRKQGLVIAGNSGTGKSHIAKALLLIGCQHLYRCRYTTAADMLTELMASLADQSLHQKLKHYTSPDILLIDELGFDRLEQQDTKNASLFFKVIDGRYCKGSTLLTTNIDFKDLGDYLGDPVTTAIVDRMVHHSIILHIRDPVGECTNLRNSTVRQGKQNQKRSSCSRGLLLRPRPFLREALHRQTKNKTTGWVSKPVAISSQTHKHATSG